MLALFRSRLALRLAALFVLVASLPMGLAILLAYQRATASLTGIALSRTNQETQLLAKNPELAVHSRYRWHNLRAGRMPGPFDTASLIVRCGDVRSLEILRLETQA